MRYLHTIGADESFVAQGTYTCFMLSSWKDKGKAAPPEQIILGKHATIPNWYTVLVPSGVKEFWTLHQRPDKSRIIRADRRSYQADNGMHILATLLLSPLGRAERMQMRVYVDRSNENYRRIDSELFAQASFSFFDDAVLIRRQSLVERRNVIGPVHDKGLVETHEMTLPQGYLVSFGRMTIGIEAVLEAALQIPEENRLDDIHGNSDLSQEQLRLSRVPVFSPTNDGGFPLHFYPSHLLRGQLEYFSAQRLENHEYPLGKETLAAQRCQLEIHHEQGGIGFSVIYGENGLLLQYGTGYIYRLTEFYHSKSIPLK